MAILGKRRTVREQIREVYWCTCYSTDHQIVLWTKSLDEDDEWFTDETTLEFGFYPHGLRQRLRDAWSCLRGRPTPLHDVILPYAETVALREGLDRNLRVIETHTTPVEKD